MYAMMCCDTLGMSPLPSYPILTLFILTGFHGSLAKTTRNLDHRTCQNIEKHIIQLGNTAVDILAVTDLFTELVRAPTICIEPDTFPDLYGVA